MTTLNFRLVLALAAIALLAGCAAFDAPVSAETINSLHSAEMNAAIAAAKPGTPR